MTTTPSLRPPASADETPFLAMVAASKSLHHPWAFPPASPTAYRDWCARASKPEHAPRIVRLAPDGPIAGAVNLSNIVRGALHGCFVGWYGAAGHTGRGIMTAALRLMIRHAFEDLGLHRLEANIQPGNAASRRLAIRTGFRLEGYSPRYLRIDGEWRDHERWAIRSDAWTPPSPAPEPHR